MHKLVKHVLFAAATATLAVVGLTGCGMSEPQTAQDVAIRYISNPNASNFHCDIDVNYQVSFLGQSMDFVTRVHADTAGNDTHGTTETNTFGSFVNSELYLVKNEKNYTRYLCYNPKDANATWTKTDIAESLLTNLTTSQDILKNSEFSKIDNGYQIIVSGKDVLNSLSASGTDVANTLKTLTGGNEDIIKKIDDSKGTLTFDKDCYLTDLAYNLDVTSSNSANSSSSSSTFDFDLAAGITLSVNAKIGSYGKVDASSVALPDSVKDSAVTVNAPVNSLEDLAKLIGGNDAASSSGDQASAQSNAA